MFRQMTLLNNKFSHETQNKKTGPTDSVHNYSEFRGSVAANIDYSLVSERWYFFLQLQTGPTDLFMVAPRNDAIFPKLHIRADISCYSSSSPRAASVSSSPDRDRIASSTSRGPLHPVLHRGFISNMSTPGGATIHKDQLKAKYIGTGDADMSKYEWVTNMHRDTLASHVGHYDQLSFYAVAQNESIGRVKKEFIEKMLQPCNRPPAGNKEDGEEK